MDLKNLDVTNVELAEQFADEDLITQGWVGATPNVAPAAASQTTPTPLPTPSPAPLPNTPQVTVAQVTPDQQIKIKADLEKKAKEEKDAKEQAEKDKILKIKQAEEANKIMGIEKHQFFIGAGVLLLGLVLILD